MERLVLEFDASGNRYLEVENVRLTLVEKMGEADWAHCRYYLRFAAYRNTEGNALFPGPELPLRDENLLRLIRVVMQLSEETATERQRATAA